LSTNNNIVDLCRRLRFEVAGAPAEVVTLFESFSAAIAAVPMEEPPWRDKGIESRRSMLDGEVFPGASAKRMIRVDLINGRALEGKSAGYCPAVEIWTTEGIQRVDVLELPEDLRMCFEAEVEGKYLVNLRECLTLARTAYANSKKLARKFAEYEDATQLEIDSLAEEVSELRDDWLETITECAAVYEENARLRTELEKLRQSRTM